MAKAEQLKGIIAAFDMEPKIVPRKKHYVVYIKEGDQIVDILNVMEAPVALMEPVSYTHLDVYKRQVCL